MCGHGYRGECCCNCEYQYKIRVCNCGQCPKVEGYICIVGHLMDKTYHCVYSESQHGCCELWKEREGKG